MNNIKQALIWAFSVLNQAQEPINAHLESEILLSNVLSKNRAYLFTYPEHQLTEEQIKRYHRLITLRKEGTPIAYLTGQREFWSLPLQVNDYTLIPRPETEQLVEIALELLPSEPGLRVLDLGTGSGAIALALASERPHWQIIACDKSKEALGLAEANAKQLHLTNVAFYHSDWFHSLPPEPYHAIISNPPYIAPDDPHLNQGDIRFEPLSALVSGQDGLADLQYIMTHSKNYLLPNGLILLEHGYDQKNSIASILNKLDYCKVASWTDMAGHDRISGGWKPDISEQD